MKITPLAAGASSGQSLAPETSVSPSRREAAKQAFLGESPANISPSDTHVDPQVKRMEENKRKIKMKTNASPERYEHELAPESVIPDKIEETKPPDEVTQPISPQFAALAKQRRAIQVKEMEIAAREKALAESKPSDGIDLVAKLKADPLGVLQEAGVTYEQLTEAILSGQSGVNPELQALKAKIDALEKGLDTKLTERDSQAEQQVLAEMRRETDRLVAEGDDFEMIREMRKQPAVTELIHRTWKQTGEILDVAEAAGFVEKQLVDDYSKLARLKKIQGQLAPAPVPVQQPQGQRQMRTLTNRDTASVPMSAKARAIAAFHGTLKK